MGLFPGSPGWRSRRYPITGPSEPLVLVASCVELAVACLWLKLWTRTTEGKLSSTGISASLMKPKSPRGIPVILRGNTGYHSLLTGIIARQYTEHLFMTIRWAGIGFLHPAKILPGRGFLYNFFGFILEIPVIFKENTGYHSLPTGIIARQYTGHHFMTIR